MNGIKIMFENKEIGELLFNKQDEVLVIKLQEETKNKYLGSLKLIIERIKNRAYNDLVFDAETGMVTNVEEEVFFALKQELFLNLKWMLMAR